MGRPSLLSDPVRGPAITEAFVEAFKECLPIGTACELAGVSRPTYHAWMAAGEEGAQPYADFLAAVRRARAEGEQQRLKQVREGVNGSGIPDWRANAWILERRYPDKYGASVTVRKAEENALELIIDRLREGLDPETFARCLVVIVGEGGEEGTGEARREPTQH